MLAQTCLLRVHHAVASEEVPGLLERLAQVPDPRDPRGVRHALVVVLALTACAVLAGAASLLAVGEWIADAPGQLLVLAQLDVGEKTGEPTSPPGSAATPETQADPSSSSSSHDHETGINRLRRSPAL